MKQDEPRRSLKLAEHFAPKRFFRFKTPQLFVLTVGNCATIVNEARALDISPNHREMTRRQYDNNFLFSNELRIRPELFRMRFYAFVTVGKIFFGKQNARLSYKYNYFLR